MTAAPTTTLGPSAPTLERRRHRADIEGLRAIAVLLVLAFHAGIPQLAGGYVGVDVFFVISGFLITGLIVREVRETGRLSLVRFWARRAKRLLPATAVVLSAVAVMTVLVLPATRWKSTAWDIVSSATYVVNWRLAHQSVDYLASDNAPSPVQHFWSLAVEEQFYIVWPVLIMALAALSRRAGWALRPTLAAGVVLVTVPSFVWSVYLTDQSPGEGYFVTTTRLWQLGIGAALAIAAHRIAALHRGAASILTWGGLAAILLAGFAYDAGTAFPGYTAALPTLGAAAVIAGGLISSSTKIGRLLSTRPMQEIGALSYSLYLWHWPFVVGATAAYGGDDGALPVALAVVVVAASAVPAWLTYRVVERPIHVAPVLARLHGRALAIGAMCTAISVAAAITVHIYADTIPTHLSDPTAPGARVLAAGLESGAPTDVAPSITPDPIAAVTDLEDQDVQGCNQILTEPGLLDCVLGDAESDFSVALVGDSHAWHWEPALRLIAERQGWRLEIFTKSGCGFFDGMSATGSPPSENESCVRFSQALRDRLTGPDAPDVVISAGTNRYSLYQDGRLIDRTKDDAPLIEAYVRRWTELRQAGVAHVVLRDTPWIGIDVPECVVENLDRLTACAVSREDALAPVGDAELVAAQATGTPVVDMTDYVCPTDRCAPVIGGVLVWRDAHHFTATYSRSTAPMLEAKLLETGVF